MNFEMDKTTFLFLNFSDPTKIYNSKEFIVSINIWTIWTLHYILSILFSLANATACYDVLAAWSFSQIWQKTTYLCDLIVILAQAIAGGVAGFWGGVLGLGSLYILMVILRRCLSSALAQDTEDNCGGGQQWAGRSKQISFAFLNKLSWYGYPSSY